MPRLQTACVSKAQPGQHLCEASAMRWCRATVSLWLLSSWACGLAAGAGLAPLLPHASTWSLGLARQQPGLDATAQEMDGNTTLG